ncbi:DEAD-box ATP-dependent RNA helicase 16 isoform X2 [Fagus crenata]
MTDSELVCSILLLFVSEKRPPDILVSTLACISKCFSANVLQRASIDDSLEILVLDEAYLLLSYGYEDDIKALTPRTLKCQCLLMSAISSADVEKLKKLTLHNSIILTLPEVGNITDEVIPKNIQQFWFGIKSAILNAELPHNSRLHILEVINLKCLKVLSDMFIELDVLEEQIVLVLLSSISLVGNVTLEHLRYNHNQVSPDEMDIFEEIKSF